MPKITGTQGGVNSCWL